MKRSKLTKRSALIFILVIGTTTSVVATKAGSGYLAGYLLDDAVLKNNIRMVNLALFLGADPCLENEYHVSVVARAAWYGEMEIVEILLLHGANPDIRDYLGGPSLHGVKDRRIVDLLKRAMRERNK